MSVTINEKMLVYLKANQASPASDLTSCLARWLNEDTAVPKNATARFKLLMANAASS